MGSFVYPLCSICKERHALLDGHKWPADKSMHKPPQAEAVAPPAPKRITTAQLTKKLAEALPKTEAKDLAATVDRIAHRQKQVREAVARHRAKKKAEQQPVSNG